MVAKVTQLPRAGRHASGPNEADIQQEMARTRTVARLLLVGAVVASAVWIGLCLLYVNTVLGWDLAARMLPHEIGAMIAGASLPIAILWIVVAFFRRSYEIRQYTETLQRQYELLTYPSEEAETRIHDISESLKRQSEELTRASDKAAAQLQNLSESMERWARSTAWPGAWKRNARKSATAWTRTPVGSKRSPRGR